MLDKKRKHVLLWGGIMAVGWWCFILPLGTGSAALYSWQDVFNKTLALFIFGVITSFLVGLSAWVLIGKESKRPITWIFPIFIGYGIGGVASFWMALFLLSLTAKMNRTNLFEGPDQIIYFPLHLQFILNGLIVGFSSSFLLQAVIKMKDLKSKLLWTFGTTLLWGIGFWETGFSFRVSGLIVKILFGILVGTGSVLLLKVSNNNNKREKEVI